MRSRVCKLLAISGVMLAQPVTAAPEGTLDVGDDHHRVGFECRGSGSPTIMLESVTDAGGLDFFSDDFVGVLAANHRTCAYDRIGTTSRSDGPTTDRRTLTDLVAELHDVVSAAALAVPFVLMGSSGGGMIAAQYSLVHPEDLAGLVLIDPGIPNPKLGDEFPGAAAWDNVEHMDWVDAELQMSGLEAQPVQLPLVVVASENSTAGDLSFWLRLSSIGQQISVAGDSERHVPHVTATAAAVLDALEAALADTGVEKPGATLIGSWHRPQTCAEMLAAFDTAGLTEGHREWIQGNFFGGQPGPPTGDPCAGARGPFEHSHFFTEEGEFGSRDEHGVRVDDGHFTFVDDDTISFTGEGDEGDVLIDFAIQDDVVTFNVVIPEQCTAGCADLHAWATSAFSSGPWQRGTWP